MGLYPVTCAALRVLSDKMGALSKMLTTEERTWAVFSHLSALAFGMGILVPILGWAEQRRKSNYAAFQCLQALGYQSLGYTIWLVLYLLMSLIFLFVLILAAGLAGGNGGAMDSVMGTWMATFLFFVFGFLGVYLLMPIVAAVACALGRDFHYPVMGKRLARYLGYAVSSDNEWLIEDHEDRWVSSMGHFSVIIPLWGTLAPSTAWILQGSRSLFLRFQSMQIFVYQVGVNIFYFGTMFVYFAGFFLFVIILGLAGDVKLGSSASMFGLVLFIVFSVLALFIILLLPMLHILGQWAGYRVLKGDNYHYPLLGKLVGEWVSKQDKNNIQANGEI